MKTDGPPLVSAICECGGTYALTYIEGREAVTHSLPPCITYVAMDPLLFAQRQRKRIEREIKESQS